MRIAVLDDYQGIAAGMAEWNRIPDASCSFFANHVSDPAELMTMLAEFDVVQMMRERTPIPGDLLRTLPKLKLLAGTGRRQPHVDMETASKLGITVTGTGGSSDSTPELAWGLIIGLTRNLASEDQALRKGLWQTAIGPSLSGKTLGILGMGRIGTQMAGIAAVFGMRVIAWGPTLTNERARRSGAELVAWEELFASSDIVTIHVPLTELSHGFVTERELRLMKPGAYLINTSRGPIVQEGALVAALKTGSIAGAALDVYEREPLSLTDPILSAPNTLLSPHLGYASLEGIRGFYRESVDNIESWLRGEPVNVLNEPELCA